MAERMAKRMAERSGKQAEKTFFHTVRRKCILKHNHIDFKRKIPTEKVKKNDNFLAIYLFCFYT